MKYNLSLLLIFILLFDGIACGEYLTQIKPCTDIKGNKVIPCEVLDESNRSITRTLLGNQTYSIHEKSTYYFHWTLSKSEGRYLDEPRKNITFIASACTGRINLSIAPPVYFPLTSQYNQYENWTVNGTNGGDLKITLSLDFGQYFLAVNGEENSHYLITYIIHDKGDIDLGNNGEIMINSTKNQDDYVPAKDTPQKQLIQFYRNKLNDTNRIKFYIVSVRHSNSKKIYCGSNEIECNINSYCGITYIQQNPEITKSDVRIYEVDLNNTVNSENNEKVNKSIEINDENTYSNNNDKNDDDDKKVSYLIPDLKFDDVYSFNVIMEYDGKYNFSYNGGYGVVELDWKNKTFPDWLTYTIVGIASLFIFTLLVVMIYNHRKLEAKCDVRKKRNRECQTKKSK